MVNGTKNHLILRNDISLSFALTNDYLFDE